MQMAANYAKVDSVFSLDAGFQQVKKIFKNPIYFRNCIG